MRTSIAVIIEIIKKEFFQIRRDKRMMSLSLVAPVMQILLLGYAATTDIQYSNLVVCDMDKSEESRAFIRGFTNSSYFIEKYSVDVPRDIDDYIDDGKASIALVVPHDFGSDILGRKTAVVQVIVDGAEANSATILLGYASQIVGSYGQLVSASYAAQMQGIKARHILAEPRVWFNPDLRSSHYMVPGVVALVLMIITMTLTSLGIVKEKEIGTLEQLLVTPIKPYQLILGKLIPFTMIGFLDVVVVLSVAHFWFDIPMLGSLPLLFALSALFIMTTLGLGLFISTIAKSQQQAMLIAQFFFFMPFTFLSGFTFPIANMPVIIQYVTFGIPLRYFLEIVRGIFLKGAGISQLWPQAAALLLIGASVLTLSVMRFRRRLE